MFASSKRVALGVALALPAVGAVSGSPASADVTPSSSPPVGHHCITQAVPASTPGATGSGVTCFATFAEAMAALGVSVPGTATPTDPGLATAAAGSNLLAVHYQNYDGTGDSLSVTGADCNSVVADTGYYGGLLSSTQHFMCSRAKHYTGTNFSGSAQLTTGSWGQLVSLNATLNDNVHSIKYLA